MGDGILRLTEYERRVYDEHHIHCRDRDRGRARGGLLPRAVGQVSGPGAAEDGRPASEIREHHADIRDDQNKNP